MTVHNYFETRLDKGPVASCGLSGRNVTMTSDLSKVDCTTCLSRVRSRTSVVPRTDTHANTSETTRYNIRSVRKMVAQLEAWIEQSEETLDNEESKDYPNDERIDSLNERLDALNAALEALESIE